MIRFCILIHVNISYRLACITTLYDDVRACKLILAQEYNGLEESLKRLDMFSFDQSVFLNKAKIMYKVYNNLAPNYLQELFHRRDVNAKCNLFKSSLTFSGVIVWNIIPLSIKMSPSLDIFVKRCINWMKD